jgi:predicted xylose isomerase-like sugar epimerase
MNIFCHSRLTVAVPVNDVDQGVANRERCTIGARTMTLCPTNNASWKTGDTDTDEIST